MGESGLPMPLPPGDATHCSGVSLVLAAGERALQCLISSAPQGRPVLLIEKIFSCWGAAGAACQSPWTGRYPDLYRHRPWSALSPSRS